MNSATTCTDPISSFSSFTMAGSDLTDPIPTVGIAESQSHGQPVPIRIAGDATIGRSFQCKPFADDDIALIQLVNFVDMSGRSSGWVGTGGSYDFPWMIFIDGERVGYAKELKRDGSSIFLEIEGEAGEFRIDLKAATIAEKKSKTEWVPAFRVTSAQT